MRVPALKPYISSARFRVLATRWDANPRAMITLVVELPVPRAGYTQATIVAGTAIWNERTGEHHRVWWTSGATDPGLAECEKAVKALRILERNTAARTENLLAGRVDDIRVAIGKLRVEDLRVYVNRYTSPHIGALATRTAEFSPDDPFVAPTTLYEALDILQRGLDDAATESAAKLATARRAVTA